MTVGLHNSCVKKNNIYKAILKGLRSLEEYKCYRNNLTSTLRAAKIAYFTNFINNHRRNTRAMWQVINRHLRHESNTNLMFEFPNLN